MRGKHIPERSCVGCRAKRPKGELLRVVPWAASAGVELKIDEKQRLPGRGAYVCRDASCCASSAPRTKMCGFN